MSSEPTRASLAQKKEIELSTSTFQAQWLKAGSRVEVTMIAPENTATADLIQCHACYTQQLRLDKYCRQCGANQRVKIASVDKDARTTTLPPKPIHDGSFSEDFVNLAAESVSARPSSSFAKDWMIGLASALIAVPLWLMIILLSPLDAYVAARAIVRRG
jgi:hypothetical protein